MKHKIIQAATAALLAGMVPAAHAIPTLSFSVDGGPTITCADGAVCDTNASAGVVTFSQSLGDFVVNVSTGLSKPTLTTGAPLIDLNTVNVQVTGGAHTLQIGFSDTGFDIYGGRITTDYGGTLNGIGASLDYSAYYDAGNTLFGQGTLIGGGSSGSGAYSGSADGGWSPNADYSVTEILTLTTGGGMTVFSGDFSVNVPEPGTLALVGLALLGFAAAYRRRVPARASASRP
ncbi:MAG TPA: PEP-CTERM sorting domain-containing protein [Burkholderiales bacterium]|nr:PEP-CTERM sorting domain-containing protein [Burkholderiales bacterium]